MLTCPEIKKISVEPVEQKSSSSFKNGQEKSPELNKEENEIRDRFFSFLQERNIEPTQLIKNSFEIAVAAHKGQRRNSGELYLNHVVRVAIFDIEFHNETSDEQISSDLLHDTVEDKPEIIVNLANNKYGSNMFTIDKPFDALTCLTTKRVARTAKIVTNSKIKDGDDEQKIYTKHISKISKTKSIDYKGASRTKFADFYDNAIMGDDADIEKKMKLDIRYSDVIDFWIEWVSNETDIPINIKNELLIILNIVRIEMKERAKILKNTETKKDTKTEEYKKLIGRTAINSTDTSFNLSRYLKSQKMI